jgi:ribosomal protein L11 methylase PrmA
MNWIEVSLHADGEAVEAIADLLQQYGYQGVAIEQLGIVADASEDDLPAPTDMIVRAYLPRRCPGRRKNLKRRWKTASTTWR